MQELWKYALEDISRRYKKIAEFAPLTVILTVPAIWPEYARNKMKQAAKLAGICEDRIAGETVVDLVSEPEAAAIATMSSFVTDRPDIKKGDIIVVLDLGGQSMVTHFTAYSFSYTNFKCVDYRRHSSKS